MTNSNNSIIKKAGGGLSHLFLLVIRLYWGWLLVMAGLSKWMDLPGTGQFFGSLDIPFPTVMAPIVGSIELIGGIALILGLFARFFSLLLIIVFIVAYLTAHQSAAVQLFVEPNVFVTEPPFLFLYTSLVVFCFGPGILSIAGLRGRQ